MKLYRVVPDSFVTDKRIDTNDKVCSEVFYYKMGYIPFSGKIGKHDFNNLNCENRQGKYFNLFAEYSKM